MKIHILVNIYSTMRTYFALSSIVLLTVCTFFVSTPAYAQHAATFTSTIRRDIKPADVPLQTSTKQATSLKHELEAAEPQVVNFVFTTCSTICSTQTATLAVLQKKLQSAKQPAKFMSFTIDPDNDTPDQLAKFSKQFGITQGWSFFTGRYDDMIKPQQAFDVYRGAKVNHPPVVLLRKSATSPWVRIEGFPTPDELMQVYRTLPIS